MFFRFLLFLIPVGVLIGVYAYFIVRRLFRFYLKRKSKKITAVTVVLSAVIAALCIYMSSTVAIVMLHLVAAFGLCDLLCVIIKGVLRLVKRKNIKARPVLGKIYRCGVVPVLITAIVMSYGFYNMANPVKTEYTVKTDKLSRNYTVAFISDTHFGTIQSTDCLKNAADEISAICPDVVILGGDIIEDGTSNSDMRLAFEILGSIKTKFGVYYIYGNHDRQNYSSHKNYSSKELENTIESNGIKILADEFVEIDNELVLAGRNDSGFGMGQTVNRADISDVLSAADNKKFTLVADHRPTDIEADAAAGVDLVLSGHTHAGQIAPVGMVQSLFGAYIYGEYFEGDCELIVSSGFAGWGYSVRTEKRSEYVVVNIQR